MFTKTLTILLLMICFFSSSSFAFEQEIESNEFNLSIYLGKGRIETPLIDRGDLSVNIFPSITYYGEKFFIDGTTIGYSLLETDNLLIDVVGLLNEDGMFYHFDSNKNYTLANILGYNPGTVGNKFPDLSGFATIERDISYLGGISFTFMTDYFNTRVGYFHDVTNVHNGNELHLSISKGFNFEWFNASIELGQIEKSINLVNYYYQFTEAELHVFKRSGYTAESGTNRYYKVNVEVPISESFSLVAAFKHTLIGDEIRESILIDKGNFITSFIGLKYQY